MILFAILDGPDGVSFNPPGPVYMGNRDELLSVTCIADCYPGCLYSWTSQTGQVSSSDILYLRSLQRDSAGTYTCTARNTYTGIQWTATKTITVNVRCKFLYLN